MNSRYEQFHQFHSIDRHFRRRILQISLAIFWNSKF